LCVCGKCKAVNPWRSDTRYAVGDNILTGFLGVCRVCGDRGFQQVTQITDTPDEALALADRVDGDLTS